MQLTIGKLASQSGVTIETIRYYQRFGILQEPIKPEHGYRQYPTEAIGKIRFIKRAQQAGFSLKEISELLSLDGAHCHDVRMLAEQKYQKIDSQIKDLIALREALSTLIKSCQQTPSSEHCAILDALTSENSSRSST